MGIAEATKMEGGKKVGHLGIKSDGSHVHKAAKKPIRNPTCSKCTYHEQLSIPIKGHKRKCPYKDCHCPWCGLLVERQQVLSQQNSYMRDQKQRNEMNAGSLLQSYDSTPGVISPYASTLSVPNVNCQNIGYLSSGLQNNNSNYGTNLHQNNTSYPSTTVQSPDMTTYSSAYARDIKSSQSSYLPFLGSPEKKTSQLYYGTNGGGGSNSYSENNFANIATLCDYPADSKKIFSNLGSMNIASHTNGSNRQLCSTIDMSPPPSNSASSSPHSHPPSPPLSDPMATHTNSTLFSSGGSLGGDLFNSDGPYCDRCQHHGEIRLLKGHKLICPHRNCTCAHCSLNAERKLVQNDLRQHKTNYGGLSLSETSHSTVSTSNSFMQTPYNGNYLSTIQDQTLPTTTYSSYSCGVPMTPPSSSQSQPFSLPESNQWPLMFPSFMPNITQPEMSCKKTFLDGKFPTMGDLCPL